jgi:hypothetical protein
MGTSRRARCILRRMPVAGQPSLTRRRSTPVFYVDTDDLVVKPIFNEELFVDTEPDSDDLDDEPIYDTNFDNLNDEPIFDEDLFIDPVCDDAANSDNVPDNLDLRPLLLEQVRDGMVSKKGSVTTHALEFAEQAARVLMIKFGKANKTGCSSFLFWIVQF